MDLPCGLPGSQPAPAPPARDTGEDRAAGAAAAVPPRALPATGAAAPRPQRSAGVGVTSLKPNSSSEFHRIQQANLSPGFGCSDRGEARGAPEERDTQGPLWPVLSRKSDRSKVNAATGKLKPARPRPGESGGRAAPRHRQGCNRPVYATEFYFGFSSEKTKPKSSLKVSVSFSQDAGEGRTRGKHKSKNGTTAARPSRSPRLPGGAAQQKSHRPARGRRQTLPLVRSAGSCRFTAALLPGKRAAPHPARRTGASSPSAFRDVA